MTKLLLIPFAAAFAFAYSIAAPAQTLVKVEFWDKGAATEMSTGLGYGMAGHDMSKATMGMKISTDSVKAGSITFEATNNSKDVAHEMVVVLLADPTASLPYSETESRVPEDKVDAKGEIPETEPGKTGTLTVDLKPGTYLLLCNIAFHDMAGMWAKFTVTE